MTDRPVDCNRIGKLIGGCNWQGRYDRSAADLSVFESIKMDGDLINAFRKETYVRDVCQTCGRTIERVS